MDKVGELCENPETTTTTKEADYLENYELHQSFFTKSELTAQPDYKIIKYDHSPDSLEPVLHHHENVYMGGFHHGMHHGWGILITKSTVYEGKFSLGHKMGKGYMKFPNNSVYIGDFTNDKPHGQGMMQLED